jgi:RNA polymerase sigma factor (TIGR02999 family)
MAESRQEITRILQEIPERPEAAAELLPLVYEELRSLARARMAQERAGHTLRATALVHEAYLRLAGNGDLVWQDRAHFFRASAEAMRRVLIDHARAKGAVKRGGGRGRVRIDAVDLGVESDPAQVLALDEALETLRSEDDRAADVVRLRFYAGLDFAEIATLLGCSERTVMREWAFARARLVELLEEPG